jgi:hypothetical protein
MTTRQLVRGDRVKLGDGTRATIADDNRQGKTRAVTVRIGDPLFGGSETGDVHAHGIVAKILADGVSEIPIAAEDYQEKLDRYLSCMGWK